MSTYTPIASITLASASSSVTFSGIPQTYTDLVLVSAPLTDTNGMGVRLQFNGDTGSNYSRTVLTGYSSTAGSTRFTNQTAISSNWQVGGGTGSPSSHIHNIQNYSNTTTNKTVILRGNFAPYSGLSEVTAEVGLWRNTAAITSINIANSAGNFASGSTFNLYGVANASITNTAKATGGDSVVTDGSYWYHVFRSSGTFTPTQAITADCLVIAGGGGGGGGYSTGGIGGGGGGAGGLLAHTSQALTATNYTVTIGAGGNAGTSGSSPTSGTQGSNSQFGSLTASVGGGFGARYSIAGGNGGSGGGGGGNGTNVGGTATSGQGSNGGNGVNDGAGGGGGASAVGTAASSNNGGNGGNGSSAYSSWGAATATGENSGGTYYYAGGAGGGGNGSTSNSLAGLGGGGRGARNISNIQTATSGTANTGGGGGGGKDSSEPGAGGSGIVIVRYAV